VRKAWRDEGCKGLRVGHPFGREHVVEQRKFRGAVLKLGLHACDHADDLALSSPRRDVLSQAGGRGVRTSRRDARGLLALVPREHFRQHRDPHGQRWTAHDGCLQKVVLLEPRPDAVEDAEGSLWLAPAQGPQRHEPHTVEIAQASATNSSESVAMFKHCAAGTDARAGPA
jgi:hypothetical protein